MAISKKAQEATRSALSIDVPEEQVGLGVDIVEIDRIRTILTRTPSFKEKVFSAEEIQYCDRRPDPAIHYAARFAAKEAALKALGTGFSDGIGFRDVEVARLQPGIPSVRLHGRAAEVAEEMGVTDIPLSISHTSSEAVACAIAITRGAALKASGRKDPAEELTRKFKEARAMLDEI